MWSHEMVKDFGLNSNLDSEKKDNIKNTLIYY